MSEINFTDSQRAAIEVTAPKILISAAAGSGKSTVLTERIISSVTSEKKSFDISKILAVTFTKASAEDLKKKIGNAVRDAVLEDPQNERLKSQLLKLSSAKISTIHGLCFTLIKSHFQMLGLSAGIRVADEVESAAIQTEVLESLLENAYAGYFEPIPDFSYFVENFVTERDDSLSKILISVYEKIKNIPNGFDEWEKKIDSLTFDGDFGSTDYGRLILFHLSLFTDYAILLCQKTVEKLSNDENYKIKYLPAFDYDLAFLKSLKGEVGNGDYEKVSTLLSEYSPVSLKSMSSSQKTDDGEYARTVVKPFVKDNIKDFREKFFSVDVDGIKKIGTETSRIGTELILLLKELDRRFSAEKLRRSLLDFNDLEQYTLKLLYTPDGRISDTAKRISASLDEIYVDEYQDVNPLQNKIFEALSVSCPIFMVGDIKQSIYSFRGAESTIFSNYRKSFTEYVPNKKDYERDVTVFLSDNFRSAKTVTEFVNAVSDPLFTTPEGDKNYAFRIPYSTADRLICNVKDDAPEVSILIADEKKVTADTETSAEEISLPASGAACFLEAEMVANKISSLISEGTLPSEIAILLRSTKTDASVFEAALKKRNIPISTDKGSSLFDAPEIQLSLCLLNCVDNPYRDIFLAGALRSPVFGFTLDDLITVRRSQKNGASLFDALKEYTALFGYQKGINFLEFLSRMRAYASQNTVDRTLWQIYTETAFFTLIYDGGAANGTVPLARRANLLKLHGIAKEFATSGKSDLFSFIEYVRDMIVGEKTPSAASIQGDGVKILSIHRSKGLEFTHCFVSRTTRAFSSESHKCSVIISHDHGIAMRIKDELRLTSADNVYRQTLLMQGDLSETEEEMRLLYVALSRAKTALYVTGAVKDFETLERSCLYSAQAPHPMLFFSQNNYLKWILTALKCKTDLTPRYTLTVLSPSEIFNETKTRIFTDVSLKKAIEKGMDAKGEKEAKRMEDGTAVSLEEGRSEDISDAYDVLKERFQFVYPYEKTAFIPSKLSVSTLTPNTLDNNEDEPLLLEDNGEFLIPDLLSLIPTDETPDVTEFIVGTQEEGIEITDFDDIAESRHSHEGSPDKTQYEEVKATKRSGEDANQDAENDNSAKMKTPAFLLDKKSFTPAEKGTSTHIFMQFCDFESVEKNGVDSEIARLIEKRFILPAHEEMIQREPINRFFSSKLYGMIKKAVSLQREYRFNIKLPASDFTENQTLKEQVKDDFIFVQGVIDCYFKDADGNIYLLDYKTDRVPKKHLGNEKEENAFFADKYSSQLTYYKKALEKLTGKSVYKTLIYSFALGRTVELD